jgi:hypothetical protein
MLAMTGFKAPQDLRNVAQPQAMLKIAPQTLKVRVGQKTTVDLAIDQVSELYGAQIQLRFDPEVLEVVDANLEQEGIQIEPGSFPIPDFVVQNTANNQTGIVDYAATQLPPNKPASGTGVIARITFQAKKAATSQIQFGQFLLADTKGSNIQAIPQHGQVRVLSNTGWLVFVAVGLTLLLGIGGGVGLSLIKRK